MRRLLFILVMLPGVAFAAENKSKFNIFGFYGLNMVSPADLNAIQNTFTAPRPGDITSATSLGGGLGMHLGKKFGVRFSYDMMEAKNLAAGSNAGFTVFQNTLWGDLTYDLVDGKRVNVYVGAGGGYSMESRVRRKVGTTTTEFTADPAIGARGVLGMNLMLGNHFAFFVEAAYQYYMSPAIKQGAAFLSDASGSGRAELNLSGARGLGGLAIMF